MDDQHWIAQAKEHWRQFRPDLYREAKAEGKLNSLLAEAARLTRREMDSLLAAGMSEQAAWERTREEYLFLPESPRNAETEQARDFYEMSQMRRAAFRAYLTGE
jgi:hypothetical protein